MRKIHLLGFVCAAGLLAGCSTNIKYTAMAGAAPAAASTVALRVVDERPADKGGSKKEQVGVVRGSYGIPGAVTDGDPSVAVRTVTEATLDALAQAGVGTKDGGGRVLVATLKHYWLDGMVGYKGTVLVQYELQDSAGQVLWKGEAKGMSGGTTMFQSGGGMAQKVFEAALVELAKQALEHFRSAAFRKALS